METDSAASAKTILHVFPSFEVGGAQRRLAKLVNESKHDWTHRILALNNVYDALELSDKFTRLIPTDIAMPRLMPLAVLFARSILHKYKPELLVTYNWGSIEFALAAGFMVNRPFIHVQDGFGAEESSNMLYRRQVLRRRAYPKAEHVAVISHTLAQLAGQTWSLPENSLKFIPNGIDLNSFMSAATNPKRNQLVPELNADEMVIGTIAALRPEKNLNRLIEAFAIAAKEFPNAKLVIVGDGPVRKRLERHVTQFGLDDRVYFSGYQDNPQDWMAIFDIVVLSSDTEQMPLAVLEAMAAGKPVISTDVGDIKQMVAPSNQPYIIGKSSKTLATSLCALMELPDKALAIGKDNQAKAIAEYDQQTMVTRWDALFESAMAGNRSRLHP